MRDWNQTEILKLDITTHCNAGCPLCTRTDKVTGKKVDFLPLTHVNTNDILDWVYQASENNMTGIDLVGEWGDPMMHPDIEKIIEYASSQDMEISIDTNGGIRNTEFWTRMGSYKKLCVAFGMDGFDHATSSRYRIGVDFNKALANLEAFSTESNKHRKGQISNARWQFILFDYNLDHVDNIAEYCDKNNICFELRINDRSHKHKIEPGTNDYNFYTEKYKQYKHLQNKVVA